MKKITLLAFTCLFVYNSFAQKNLPAFGVITSDELNLTSCLFEPSANAMKLIDVQEIEYEPSPFGGKIKTTKRVRIKIFNEKAFPHATISIPYYSNKKNTKIEDLQAMIYNIGSGGNITSQKLEAADFYKDKAMEKIGVIKFTFPNLKSGSIIEYTYTLSEKNRLYIDPWIIQSDIPVAYTSTSIILPTYSRIKENVFGNDSVSRKKEQLTKGLDKEKTTFFKENVSSFQPEPLMSSFNDNLLRMGFLFLPESSAFSDEIAPASIWRIIGNSLLRSSIFDLQLKKTIPGTEKIIDTALTITYLPDRVSYIYSVIKKRFPDNNGQTAAPDEIDDIWKSRSATSTQVNMLLMNFLTRSNIKCHPLLVSTRENGKINLNFPNFGQFNGMDVVAIADNSFYVMDASLKYQAYDAPPLNILNRDALLLDADNIRWIKVTDDRPLFKQNTDIFGLINAEGVLEGSATVQFHDYAKSILLDSTSKDEDSKQGKFFDTKINGLKLLSDKQENISGEDPYLRTIEFDYSLPQSEDFFFINPQFFSTKRVNPFTADKRKTDIDFGCNQAFLLNMQLEVPASFNVETLPKNIVLRSPDSSFVYTRIVSFSGNNISFSQELSLNKAIFEKNEYAGLYDFFSRIASLMAEEIILKRKK